jgi:hypothetical protein
MTCNGLMLARVYQDSSYIPPLVCHDTSLSYLL